MNESKPAKSTLEMLEEGVKNVFESSRYKAYLATMARFHQYSYGNVVLIMIQCPNATHVAGMRTWNSKVPPTVKTVF